MRVNQLETAVHQLPDFHSHVKEVLIILGAHTQLTCTKYIHSTNGTTYLTHTKGVGFPLKLLQAEGSAFQCIHYSIPRTAQTNRVYNECTEVQNPQSMHCRIRMHLSV